MLRGVFQARGQPSDPTAEATVELNQAEVTLLEREKGGEEPKQDAKGEYETIRSYYQILTCYVMFVILLGQIHC